MHTACITTAWLHTSRGPKTAVQTFDRLKTLKTPQEQAESSRTRTKASLLSSGLFTGAVETGSCVAVNSLQSPCFKRVQNELIVFLV